MTNPPSETQAAEVADQVGAALRGAGLPETAIHAWWMLLVDPDLQRTPHRVWESGDYEALWVLVEKTLADSARYRSALEKVASDHFAERLGQAQDVQNRLLGMRA